MSHKGALELSKELKAFGKTVRETAKVISDAAVNAKSIKRLIGSPGNGDLSAKLITAGMACIAFPEPLVSDILGSALIASGMLLKSRRGPTIVEIFRETSKILSGLKKLNTEV